MTIFGYKLPGILVILALLLATLTWEILLTIIYFLSLENGQNFALNMPRLISKVNLLSLKLNVALRQHFLPEKLDCLHFLQTKRKRECKISHK